MSATGGKGKVVRTSQQQARRRQPGAQLGRRAWHGCGRPSRGRNKNPRKCSIVRTHHVVYRLTPKPGRTTLTRQDRWANKQETTQVYLSMNVWMCVCMHSDINAASVRQKNSTGPSSVSQVHSEAEIEHFSQQKIAVIDCAVHEGIQNEFQQPGRGCTSSSH